MSAIGRRLGRRPSLRPRGGQAFVSQPSLAYAQIKGGLRFPNGLAFGVTGDSLVVAETYRQRLWRGGWNPETATWTTPAPWAQVGGPIGPDGLAHRPDGLLYAAIFGQGCIQAINPRGVVVATHSVPGARPTNCAYDPSGRLGLVVCEAEHGRLLSLPEL